jgi:filamentous hemagglutinin family protein
VGYRQTLTVWESQLIFLNIHKVRVVMMRTWQVQLWRLSIALLVGFNECDRVLAQIIPDRTLGSQSSRVTPINPTKDRIDGGAIRGSNLFHSFREFNIDEGRAAYFANPQAIQNIFSRVTGNNPSHIFGTLGVLGNANLFFINPQGIIFGPNATLDIRGSFIGSTANSITFPDGNKFSATNPQGVPLLTIDVPVPIGLVFEGQDGTIINAATLATGRNLALVGGTIISTGQLSSPTGEIFVSTVDKGVHSLVKLEATGEFLGREIKPFAQSPIPVISLPELVARGEGKTGLTVDSSGQVRLGTSGIVVETGDIAIAGSSDKVSLQAQTATLSSAGNLTLVESSLGTARDLNLLAKDTVRVRDSINNPFLAVAGEDLLIQGNEGVDIFALNHPNSELVSGGNIVLRSANTVIGDAHYWSGGNFRVEKLDKSLGDLFSPHDPIIRSQGDVSFFYYEGSSLHILAGGAVTIGAIVITGTDSVGNTINPISTPNLANVTLSDGTPLIIDGSKRATLDIRAGMKPEAIANPLGITGNNFNLLLPIPANNPVATSADITIGDVANFNRNGLVLLTNQYNPNSSLSGGKITIAGDDIIAPNNFRGIRSEGGEIFLDARDDITLNIGTSIADRYGGDLKLIARGDIIVSPDSFIFASGSAVSGEPPINAGDIALIAKGDLIFSPRSIVGSEGVLGGNIMLKSDGTISADNSIIGNNSLSSASSILKAGDINVSANSLVLTNGSGLTTLVFGNAKAGDINIKVRDTVTINGTVASNLQGGSQGSGGNINIETGSLIIKNGGQLGSSSEGKGDAGNITINAKNDVFLEGIKEDNIEILSGVFTKTIPTSIQSTIGTTGEGNAGKIEINASSLTLQNGASIFANVAGRGKAGDININVRENVTLSGFAIGTISVGGIIDREFSFPSSITTIAGAGALSAQVVGRGGNIIIKADSLSMTNGSLLGSSTQGQGDAGNIFLQINDSVSMSSSNIESGVNPNGVGQGGNIDIQTRSLNLTEGSQISTLVSGSIFGLPAGQGSAGNITIDATESVNISGTRPAQTAKIPSYNPLNLSTIFPSFISPELPEGLSSSLLVSTEAGATGQAGAIAINTKTFRLADGATIEAFTENASPGGEIKINANTLEIAGGGQIITTAFEQGQAGNIFLDVEDKIIIAGNDPTYRDRLSKFGTNIVSNQGAESGILANTTVDSSGNGGTIEIQTGQLSLAETGKIVSSTAGSGNAGTIKVVEADAIALDTNSQISSAVESTSTGDAGGIEIATNSFSINNNAQINASTSGEGKAGNIAVIAKTFEASDGGQLRSSTSSDFEAGDITLTIEDHLTLSGAETGLFADTEADSSGNGGDIAIASQTLIVRDGAIISVNSQGRGTGGNIEIEAGNLTLDDGKISAQTASTTGGNITLDVDNLLTLRNASEISTTAGTARSGGDGGNINLSANFILALPQENSDITANAFTGDGGRINIAAQNIFGIDTRQRLTPLSDITASSEFGLQGIVSINTTGVDPTRGLENLPEQAVNPQVIQTCQARGGGATAEFFNVGRGGLPSNPDELFYDEPFVNQGLIPLISESEISSIRDRTQDFTPKTELKLSCE